MAKNYPILWLDNLINSYLDPEKNKVDFLRKTASEITNTQIKKETAAIQYKIKNRVFSMNKESHIRLFINNHHRSFKVLLSQLSTYRQFKVYQDPELLDMLGVLHTEIKELQHFIEVWFAEYLGNDTSTNVYSRRSYSKKFPEKILCNLSGDQAAIVLRAADESKILQARSMSSVFKAIVPHLSTPLRKNLSYNSLRVKSYNIEEKDKEIAIDRLKLMIKKIEEY